MAIFAIALMTQAGLFWGYYLYYVIPRADLMITDAVLMRIPLSLCVASFVFVVAMVIYQARSPNLRSMPLDNLRVSPFVMSGLFICGGIFLGMVLLSPESRLVIDHGTDVLGGDQYYSVRGELIQLRAESGVNRGRLITRFMTFSYGILLLSSLVFVYKFSMGRQVKWLVLAVLCGIGPIVQAVLSFQKGPVVMTIGAYLLIILLFRRSEFRVQIRYSGAVVAAMIIAAIGMSSYVIFQGESIVAAGESVFERAFLVPISTSLSHATVYPEYYPFVRFGDFGLAREFLPATGHVPMYGSMAREVAITLRGMDFNANTGLIGHAWGTWGYFGVFLFSSIASGLFYAIDRFTSARRHLASVAPLIVYYWFFFINYGNTNFHNLLGASSLWIIPFVYFRFFAGGSLPRQMVGGHVAAKSSSPNGSRALRKVNV